MARHRSLRIRRNHGLQFPRHDRGRHRVRRRRRHFQPSLRRPLRHPRPTRGVEVTVASATDSELGVDATPWTLLRGKASHLREILRPFIRVLRANPLTLIGFILVVIISTTALLVAIVPVISQVVLGHPVLLTPYDPNGISTDYSQAPSLKHLLRSEEHTSELQSLRHLVCRLLLEKKKDIKSLHEDDEADDVGALHLVVELHALAQHYAGEHAEDDRPVSRTC